MEVEREGEEGMSDTLVAHVGLVARLVLKAMRKKEENDERSGEDHDESPGAVRSHLRATINAHSSARQPRKHGAPVRAEGARA